MLECRYMPNQYNDTVDSRIVVDSDIVDRNPDELIAIFNGLFSAAENTRLVKGGSEPLYLPADGDCGHHQLIFAHGFFSSALHEIAHWCIAGQERRLQIDYGYWYAPDGRDSQQQAVFEQVELKPQALEWILSRACKHPFRVSVDNLSAEETDTAPFKQGVFQQLQAYLQRGLPVRAAILQRALSAAYQSPDALLPENFQLSELG